MDVKYITTSSGRNIIEEFLWELSEELRTEFFICVHQLENGQTPDHPKSKPLPGIAKGLAELRLKDASGQYRVFYYIKKGDAIYMIHGMKKKSQTISTKDKNLILQRLKGVT